MLNVQTRQEGETVVLTIQGKVDSESTAHLRAVIHGTIDSLHPKQLVVNLEGVTFIDSAGLGLLVAAHHNLGKVKVKFHLCELPPQVKKTFEETYLVNYFSIFATEPDAFRGEGSPPDPADLE